MGIGVTVVCTVAAYTYTVTQYFPNSNAGIGYTGIVNGAQCGFSLTNADSGDLEALFNTTTGLPILEGVNCTVPVSGSSCVTPYLTFSGAAYAMETIEVEQFFAGNISGYLNGTYNWTYIALPPVPSQTAQPAYNLSTNPLNISLVTSVYSAEYGFPLIGCVVSAGPSPYAGGLTPATLSSNPAQNSIPPGAYAWYPPTITQNQSLSLPLSALYVSPNSIYDLHFACFNSVGRSVDAHLFNITTSSLLPNPVLPSTAATLPMSSSSSALPISSSSSAASSTGGSNPSPSPNDATSSVTSPLASLALTAGLLGAALWL